MEATAPIWDPQVYDRYKSYRDRPALDLLLQVPADLSPREVWDLGCGTGEHAAVLANRHPGPSCTASTRARRCWRWRGGARRPSTG